ncbi:MAG: ABC transporter ATP-binding protein [Woeseiaceae bacterium]|nr:ABC transporter ATP-binding protein [Woeseiaceae bacterium]
MQCTGVSISVPGRTLVDQLDLELEPGEFVAVLGRNGVGKTLTLNTLAGLRPLESGRVLLDGKDLADLPRLYIARRLALLPQLVDDMFPASVLDTALIGRHPHIGALRWESPEDYDITLAALVTMDLGEYSKRDVLTLSGGERRRLAIAQVLAQRPDIYLLDEPTNHLDPQHQHDVLDHFRRLANDGACVVASLHDANLASRFADRCLLLHGDGNWELGDTQSVLDEARLSALYGTRVESIAWHSQKVFVTTGERPGQST